MIEFRVLGAPDLRDDAGRELRTVLVQPKRLAVLAFLSQASPGFYRRGTLLGMFWPDFTQRQASHSLSQMLYSLKNLLGSDVIATRGSDEIGLNATRIRCDIREFESALRGNELEAALELYTGEFLQGFLLANSVEFDQWVSSERVRLSEQVRVAAKALATRDAADGNRLGALRWLGKAAESSPFDEELLRDKLCLLHALGDRAGAVLEYETFAARLGRELELEPGSETRAVVARIREAPHESVVANVHVTSGETGVAGMREASQDAEQDAGQDVGIAMAAKRSGEAATASAVPPSLDQRVVRNRRVFPMLVGSVALLTVVAAFMTWGPLPREDESYAMWPAGAEETPARVAVLPFATRGATRFDYLGDGMPVLLGAMLDGVGPLRTVDSRAVLDYVDSVGDRFDADVGAAVSKRFELAYYVTGAVIEAGERVVIQAALFDASGRRRAHVTSEAVEETQIFDTVDRIARGLLASRYARYADRLSRLAVLTTPSLPALKNYLEGERSFRGGRFVDAVDAFGRAAVDDSAFALAHYRLSLAMLWADVPDTLPFDAEARASRHVDGLSSRDRLLIEAYALWRSGAADDAERLYRNLVAMYPEDAEAWHQLGETLFHYNPVRGRPLAEAQAPFEKALELDPRSWGAAWHLALLAIHDGREDQFRALAGRLLSYSPEYSRELELRALLTLVNGDTTAVSELMDELRSAHGQQVHALASHVAVYLHDPAAARVILQLLTTPDRQSLHRQFGQEALVYIELARGDHAAADERIADLARINPDQRLSFEVRALAATLPSRAVDSAALDALYGEITQWKPERSDYSLSREYLLAYLSSVRGDVVRALAHLVELERRVADTPEWSEQFRRMADGVHARVARLNGMPDHALRLLERSWKPEWFGWAAASPVHSRSHDRFLRAELLRELGRFEEAQGWYGSFGEHALHDLAFLAPAQVRSAELDGAPR